MGSVLRTDFLCKSDEKSISRDVFQLGISGGVNLLNKSVLQYLLYLSHGQRRGGGRPPSGN